MSDIGPDEYWDGGWNDQVDGGDSAEDMALGNPRPFDRDDFYTPAQRFGSRHSITSRPFADPADRVIDDRDPRSFLEWIAIHDDVAVHDRSLADLHGSQPSILG